MLDRWPPYDARENALADLARAIDHAPEALDARFYRASFLRDHGRFAESIALFETILAIVPDHVETLIALGVLLARAGRRLDARAAFERALAHAPGSVVALVNLANLLTVDDAPRALELFEAALALDARSAAAHRGICSLAAAAGDTQRANDHRAAGYPDGPFGRLPYYGQRMPIPVLALVSTDGGNLAAATVLDPQTFLVHELFVECYRDEALPPHRLILNAIADADRCPAALAAAARIVARARVPVINAPDAVAETRRIDTAARLAACPAVMMPAVEVVSRDVLPSTYPAIVRVPGQHMGRNMHLVADARAFVTACDALPPHAPLIAVRYVETRSADGAWRKYRVMRIGGNLFPLHLAIAHRWDVHYFSAAMAARADYREEEARFLADPERAIGARAWAALGRAGETLGLDYMGIDFGLTAGGTVVVFEANAAMTVLAPDPDPQFAYRRPASDAIAVALLAMMRRNAGVSSDVLRR